MLTKPDAKYGEIVYLMAHGIENTSLHDLGVEDYKAVSILDVMVALEDMGTCAIKPKGNYLEVVKIEAPDKTLGGILLPDKVKSPSNLALVRSVGLGWVGAMGNILPVGHNPGQIVNYKPFETMVVDFSTLGKDAVTYIVSAKSVMDTIRYAPPLKDELANYGLDMLGPEELDALGLGPNCGLTKEELEILVATLRPSDQELAFQEWERAQAAWRADSGANT